MAELIQGDLFGDSASGEPDPDRGRAQVRSGRSSVGRRFLGWHRPVLDSAAEILIDSQAGQRIIDLSGLLVVVPTLHGGRRLRETLASRVAQFDGVVVPPVVVSPEFLIAPDPQGPGSMRPVAGSAQTLLCWADLLRQIDLEHFRFLFPVDPVERSFSWAIQTAGDILGMRKTLGEAGLDIGRAAERLAEEGMEPARWRQLAELERRALDRLSKAGLEEFESARRKAAAQASIPPGIDRLIVLATPDPTPLVIQALDQFATQVEVEIWIHAPAERANHFDGWGRPVTQQWTAELVPIPEPYERIHLVASPAAQANLAAEILSQYDQPAGLVAIGVPDEEVIPPLERNLNARQVAAFNPGGEPLQRHELYHLLRTLADLVATRSYAAFAQLIRCPDFIRAAAAGYQADTGTTFDYLDLLRKFDELYNHHLPDNLEHTANALTKRPQGQRIPEQAFVLTLINRWLTRFGNEPLSLTLPAFLTMVYSHRKFRPELREDQVYAEISAKILAYLDEVEGPLSRNLHEPPATADLLGLLLQTLAGQAIYPDHETSGRDRIDLQGWLELLWEDSPHLIITGFNDGKVPDAILGDAYLPNRARRVLGVRDNDHRLARDAYYLTALIESRRAAGRVDLLVGKAAADGSPLSPSRLLFHCTDSELPARTRQLFRGLSDSSEQQPAAWTRSWQLTPPALPPDAKIRRQLSVTQFSDYLRCPFRFFLKHGLLMEEFDRQKLEMDSRDFGNLCHDALEAFGRDEALRDSTDPEEISRFLTNQLDRQVTYQYGSSLPVPVLIQLESAKQRLDWAARIQAREREAGWVITDVEWLVPKDPESNLPTWSIDGMPISFKIDRIERHEHSGEIRVLDYKTSDKAESPEESHLKKLPQGSRTEEYPDWAITSDREGKPRRWGNLQLPLYILALQEKYPGANEANFTAGLFKLPRAASETKIDLWNDLNSKQLESARACAAGVINAIRTETFWPPAPDKQVPDWDPFSKLFFADAKAAVAWPSNLAPPA